MSFFKSDTFCIYSLTRRWIGLISYVLVEEMCEVFEVTLHIGDTNEVSSSIVSPDLEKVFLPLFTSEMLGIALTPIICFRFIKWRHYELNLRLHLQVLFKISLLIKRVLFTLLWTIKMKNHLAWLGKMNCVKLLLMMSNMD